MTAVPTAPTFSDGVTSSTQWNQVRDAIDFLQQPPIAQLRQTSVQSLPSSTATAITFDTENVDSTSGHSTSSNTSRWQADYPGWYWIDGGVGYASNATGVRTAEWAINGFLVAGCGVLLAANSTGSARIPGRGMLIYLANGDYVETLAFQNSGGALNTAVSTQEQPSMGLKWVSS